MLDLLEASRTGACPTTLTRRLSLAMEGFSLQMVLPWPDERFVLVNETVTGRVHRLWLKGDRRGERDIFIDGLPAMVDNISFNGSDTFGWLRPTPRGAGRFG